MAPQDTEGKRSSWLSWISSCQTGITLVELSTVVAIIGILSVLILPNYIRTLPARRLKSDAMDIASYLRYAKMYSVKSGRDVGIFFNDSSSAILGIEPNSYAVFMDSDQSGTQYQMDGEDTILKANLPLRSGVEFTEITCPNNTIIFSPNGSAVNSAGSVTISNGAISRTIDVNPVSGIIRILQE